MEPTKSKGTHPFVTDDPVLDNMTSTESQQQQQALEASRIAIHDIHIQLKPFLLRIHQNGIDGCTDAHLKAQAQAVVALSIGTLRYMRARLEGSDEGRASDDPLRKELNHIRKLVAEIERKGTLPLSVKTITKTKRNPPALSTKEAKKQDEQQQKRQKR